MANLSLSLSVNASPSAMHLKNHDEHSRARACVRDMAASYAHLEIEPGAPQSQFQLLQSTRRAMGMAGWLASRLRMTSMT